MANGNGYKQPDLKNYDTDIEGVSLKKLSIGLWWLKNRKNLRNLVIALLILISVGAWGYTLYGFGNYLFFGLAEDDKLARELVQTKGVGNAFLQARAPQGLAISPAGILENDGRYDLYALIKNNNPRHLGTFDYCFTSAGQDLFCAKDFILPGDKKYLLALGKELAARPAGTALIIKSITWDRIDPHQIGDWDLFRKERLKIEVKNTAFTPAAATELSEKVSLNTLSFSVANGSAYSYWEAPFNIVLSSGGRVVGVNRYTVKDFVSYDDRSIRITWVGDLSGVNDINITPDINIMDAKVYMEPGEAE